MDLDPTAVTDRRTRLGWSQVVLATETGLDVRTIQRIESTGKASPSSARAVADALEVDVVDLELPDRSLSPCPECRSDDVRRHIDAVDTSTIGGQLFPGLAPGRFSGARLHIVACAGCGNVRLFLDDDAVERLRSASTWPTVR
jgi:transcriptional regulator with XRE-family HTH domain